jgi:hypothetical protein
LLYAAADVYVAPVDNLQESFGIAILEAMASGLPVVASDWSGYRDLVVDGQTGFLIRTSFDSTVLPVASAVSTCAVAPHTEYLVASRTVIDVEQLTQRIGILIDTPESRLRFGEAARQRAAECFSWGVVIKRFGSLWRAQSALARNSNLRKRFLDLGEVFATYPSQSEGYADHVLVCSPDAMRESEGYYGPCDERVVLLHELARRPQTYHQLTCSDDRRAALVASLLKKGVLAVKSP